ncbi:class IV adenylate cyclase [Methylomonas sp. HYX-M1]|uniref:class IV adenylate cyclase n=1 Tax=Methylomonas sp. HYX-M1 TaxID=3139307 RepID=UPI00345C2CD0
MAKNIEIKARLDSIAAVLPLAAQLADQGPFEIIQDDTFFVCANGRLKLREFAGGDGELIFYRRPDALGPKASHYLLVPTREPETLRQVLTQAYGQIGRVRKHRTLFLAGRTRIHLDCVQGLGDFLELEVVLAEHEAEAAGVAEAEDLLARLAIKRNQRIEVAYPDLLRQTGDAC